MPPVSGATISRLVEPRFSASDKMRTGCAWPNES